MLKFHKQHTDDTSDNQPTEGESKLQPPLADINLIFFFVQRKSTVERVADDQ